MSAFQLAWKDLDGLRRSEPDALGEHLRRALDLSSADDPQVRKRAKALVEKTRISLAERLKQTLADAADHDQAGRLLAACETLKGFTNLGDVPGAASAARVLGRLEATAEVLYTKDLADARRLARRGNMSGARLVVAQMDRYALSALIAQAQIAIEAEPSLPTLSVKAAGPPKSGPPPKASASLSPPVRPGPRPFLSSNGGDLRQVTSQKAVVAGAALPANVPLLAYGPVELKAADGSWITLAMGTILRVTQGDANTTIHLAQGGLLIASSGEALQIKTSLGTVQTATGAKIEVKIVGPQFQVASLDAGVLITTQSRRLWLGAGRTVLISKGSAALAVLDIRSFVTWLARRAPYGSPLGRSSTAFDARFPTSVGKFRAGTFETDPASGGYIRAGDMKKFRVKTAPRWRGQKRWGIVLAGAKSFSVTETFAIEVVARLTGSPPSRIIFATLRLKPKGKRVTATTSKALPGTGSKWQLLTLRSEAFTHLAEIDAAPTTLADYLSLSVDRRNKDFELEIDSVRVVNWTTTQESSLEKAARKRRERREARKKKYSESRRGR